MAKRKLELEDLEKTDPVPHASLHGVIKSLSPIKKGKKSDFFEGKCYFNNKSHPSRFVGFSPRQHDTLKKIKEEKKPVHFDDIEITNARRGDKMEFLIKSSTKINESPKKFDEDSFLEDSDTCCIDQLDRRQPYDRVSVRVKALNIMGNRTAENGKSIQHVLVADPTGACKCTLWEQFIGQLEPGKSYCLSEFYIQEFRNKKSIYNSMQGSTIEEIPDVAAIEATNYIDEEEGEITKAIIGAIINLDHYRACMKCNSRVEPIGTNQGRCMKDDCRILQRINLCKEHVSAKLLLKPEDALPRDTS